MNKTALAFATSSLAALALSVGPADAALSGFWDSSKIIHAILGDETTADALRQQPVEKITKTKDGYRLNSKYCEVDVHVRRLTAEHPGPTPFTIRVGDGRCE